MKKIICALLALTITFSFSACSTEKTKYEKYTASFLDLFDTASTIIAYDVSQEAFDEKYERFYKELEKYDHLYDIYSEYENITNLCTVNRLASNEPVKVSEEIIDLLQFGKTVYSQSKGKTNICFGTVLELWHNERELAKDYPEQAKLPDIDELKKANEHTNIDDLIIDEENSTVYFNDENMRLDVGAIAKGFAVARVTQFAKENLWVSAAISIGGNVTTYGYKNNDGTTLWKIGIESPMENAEDYSETVSITDLSVVTSGDYQRYFYVEDKKYCHIINPDTLMPSEYMASVSVLCEDSGLGDALSTTLFNMSIDEGKEYVEALDGVEALWVDKQYNKTYSSGFEKFISKD